MCVSQGLRLLGTGTCFMDMTLEGEIMTRKDLSCLKSMQISVMKLDSVRRVTEDGCWI